MWAARIPIVLTSYHEVEAELDARTLVFGARIPAACVLEAAVPNPFASMLPHLDELFVGRTYNANAYRTIAVP